RYLALSYVWGDGRFYKTCGADVPALRKHGSLAPSAKLFNVPRTVRDAMALAKQLGEKYLWVDALCIIQDDDTHRTQQLRLMDRIYRHSVMTVIALSGGDAWSGLPGVGSGLRRRIMPVESIEGEAYSLTIEPPHLRHVVDLSAWSIRAWTFQEQLLSRRCLYLSDWQAYFQCQGTTYSIDRLNPLTEMACWDDGYTSYQKLVGYYLRRSMTRESDILNAFEGVSAFMQAQLGGSFFAGVPEALIDFCLLWAP
ncbi:heterokaryon incompatibility protein-domain-containing protein, partial [Apiosordaria backusii]